MSSQSWVILRGRDGLSSVVAAREGKTGIGIGSTGRLEVNPGTSPAGFSIPDLVGYGIGSPEDAIGPGGQDLFVVNPSSPVTFRVTNDGTEYLIGLDLVCGGMISSLQRGGVELLRGNPRTQGAQFGMVWTDLVQGEPVCRQIVQGGQVDREYGGVLLTLSTVNLGTSLVVRVQYQAIIQAPDGRGSQPFVSTWHNPEGDMVVWRDGTTWTTEYVLNVGGTKDLHSMRTTLQNPTGSSYVSAHFDMAMYHSFVPNIAIMPNLRLYDGTTDTSISTGTSGVTGYQAANRRYMLDSVKLKGDNEADNTGLKAAAGIVSCTGANDTAQAFGVGNTLSTEVKNATNRSLGDTPRGNAWTWLQDSSRILLAHGSFLSSRIHNADAVRRLTIGDRPLSLTTYFVTGNNTQNKALISGFA